MFQKIKIILYMGMFIIGAFGLNAQTDTIVSNVPKAEQGEIVISKSELIRFLDKIANARKDKIEFELENIYLDALYPQSLLHGYDASNIATGDAIAPLQTMSRDQLMREVEVLTSRLNAIAGYAGSGSSTTIIASPGYDYSQDGAYYPYQSTVPYATGLAFGGNNGELRWKIDSLQREVSLLSKPGIAVENQNLISRLNQEIDRKQDSLIILSPLTPQAKEIIRSYGTSQMQVFFENDVSNIAPRYFEEIERAAIVLRRNPQLAVVLKGFASTVGSPRYNYDLSMRRNEAVKRMLIDYGVFPDQISSVFYGEDATSSASNARRVDIKFIIK